MRLTKFGHACVRLEQDGAVLVIDPGTLSERAALDGVDAVLITHEHADHVDLDALTAALVQRPSAVVYTHLDVIPTLNGVDRDRVTAILAGTEFTAAGFPVRTYGGEHAVIHPDIPRVANLGYLVGGSLYHPGDSFVAPTGAHVQTLLTPVSAPWLKISEAVDFVRAVGPRQAYALHDGMLTDAGHQVVTRLMSRLAGCQYDRLEPGTSVPL